MFRAAALQLGGPGRTCRLAGTRSVGVFFPANGKFYVMGGRDVNNVELTNPFEYDPGSNSWTTKSATYPDSLYEQHGLRRT